jgi:hypothetical protein
MKTKPDLRLPEKRRLRLTHKIRIKGPEIMLRKLSPGLRVECDLKDLAPAERPKKRDLPEILMWAIARLDTRRLR